MRGRKSIRGTLFFAYSGIITITAIILVVYFAQWGALRLQQDAHARLSTLLETISVNIDGELRKLDDVSLAVLYSNLVKDRFMKYIGVSDPARRNLTFSTLTTNEGELVDLLLAIIGPAMNARQINIYDFHGRGFGTGMDNRSRTIDPSTPWFVRAIGAGGSMVLSGPHPDDALQRISSVESANKESFISLGRLLFNRYNTPIGVVEVEESTDRIFAVLDKAQEVAGAGEHAMAFDADGKLLYPRTPRNPREIATYLGMSRSQGTGVSRATHNPVTGRREIAEFRSSDYTGWTIAVVSDEGALFSPLSTFIRDSVFITLLILSASLIIAFMVARRITRPIALLRSAITAIDLDSLGEQPQQGPMSDLNEIESLNHAFLAMQTKLRRSIDEHLLSHRREMQARMLALQSQMNPHFLYNTLATISVLAEEGLSDSAVALCANVSRMLRYISSHESTFAEAGAELEYTRQYLQCIVARHGSKLLPLFETDAGFGSLRIPKLVIQPLVENAVKYGTGRDPPWTIQVRACVSHDAWRVTVQDDGPGFTTAALAEVRSRVETAGEGNEFHGLELDGMGLANIAIRLRLAYGGDAFFSCGNRTDGGAYVEVGGPLRPPEEEGYARAAQD